MAKRKPDSTDAYLAELRAKGVEFTEGKTVAFPEITPETTNTAISPGVQSSVHSAHSGCAVGIIRVVAINDFFAEYADRLRGVDADVVFVLPVLVRAEDGDVGVGADFDPFAGLPCEHHHSEVVLDGDIEFSGCPVAVSEDGDVDLAVGYVHPDTSPESATDDEHCVLLVRLPIGEAWVCGRVCDMHTPCGLLAGDPLPHPAAWQAGGGEHGQVGEDEDGDEGVAHDFSSGGGW